MGWNGLLLLFSRLIPGFLNSRFFLEPINWELGGTIVFDNVLFNMSLLNDTYVTLITVDESSILNVITYKVGVKNSRLSNIRS